jgi:putative tryptophan/tyrosine transport system substrate-binding protein
MTATMSSSRALENCIRRRQFITLIGGAAATWPLAASAQPSDKIWRIAVLSSLSESDHQQQSWDAAFRRKLNELGWIDGRNIRLDYRWGAGNVERVQLFAKELVGLNPDVLVAITTPSTAALQKETRTIPIVFAVVSDPVGSGLVASLANPGGNITGFINIEGSLGGKWPELMRDVSPRITRVAVMFNPITAPYARYYVDAFHSAAAALSMEPIEYQVHSSAEIEAAMAKLGGIADSGLVVIPDTFVVVNRQTIISLADRYRLPTIYPFDFFVSDGGLMSYGVDVTDLFRGTASYVDRILRGAKPSELAGQIPTKFQLAINLKTAKARGISFSQMLVARADEVIE